MSEWKEYRLNEIGTVVGGATPSTMHPEYYDGSIPWITPKDLTNWKDVYISKGERSITEAGYKSASCKIMPRGSVLFSSRAPIGYIAIAANDICTNQGFKSVVPNPDLVESVFLYYSLLYNRERIKELGSGTTFAEISGKVMSNVCIRIPSLQEQRSIASILSSLDSKIENNRKICANLEAQAQALFKHWFIDFAPFKDGKFVESELGMIPEGWRVGTLTDILENIKYTIKQGDFPELPYLPIDSIPMYSFLVNDIKDNSEAQSSLILFKKYDILVGAMRVYFHRVIPAPFDGITRSTCFVLRPKVWNFYSFALCSVNSNQAILHAQKTSKGSTMPYAVWEGGLGAFSIVIPPESVAREFNYLIKKYIDIIQYTYFENQKLTSLRDTLLPKLMSGEIKV